MSDAAPTPIPIPQLAQAFPPWYDWTIRERFRIKQRSESDERPLFERLLERSGRPRPDLGFVANNAAELYESLRPARGADLRAERLFRATVWLKVLWNELGLTPGGPIPSFIGPPEVRSALADLSEIVLELGKLWGIRHSGESAAAIPTKLTQPNNRLIQDLGGALTRLRQRAGDKQAGEKEPPVGRVSPDRGGGNVIRQEAEYWHLRFGEEKGSYKHRACLPWLAKLLLSPNRSLTVAELLGDPDGKLAADAQLGGEPQTDHDGIRAIWERMEDINSLLETGPSDALESEKALLLKRVEKFAAKKRMPTSVGKAYNNITTQLRQFRSCLKKFMPNLTTHLEACTKPESSDFSIGYFPPSGTVPWKQ